jgi:predicted MFS family arabinose efflux permease
MIAPGWSAGPALPGIRWSLHLLTGTYDLAIDHPIPSARPDVVERALRPAVATLVSLKLVVNTALRFVYPFLPAIARGLGIDLTQAGMLVSVRWASSLTTPAVMSFAGDVHRTRRLLVAGLAMFSAGSIVTAWAGVFIGAVVGFVLAGLAKPMIDIGSQLYVAERVPYRRRARYLGILEVAWAGGLLVGAPAAGWLIANWSWEAPFWALGSLGLVGMGLALLFLDRHDEAAANRAARAPDSPGRQVMLLLGTIALFGFAHEGVLVTLGGWLEGSFSLTLLALGGVGTLLGLSELAGEGAMVAFTDRLGKRNALALGLGVGCVSLLALSFSSETLVPAMASLAIATVAMEFGYISVIPLMTELRPRGRTRILALSVVANGAGRIAGDFISPRLFTAGGMQMVTIVSASVVLAAVILILAGVKEVSAEERARAGTES